ncbi:ankyrin repeat domain-containing protein [Capsulimonas corticalis]|nr:ankyrin repeat domain-containing protein [Capsulimonas corticalis]
MLLIAVCLSFPVAFRAVAQTSHGAHRNLDRAFRNSDWDIARLKRLLAQGANVDAKDDAGQTRLDSAVRLGRTREVQFLLDAGADANHASYEGAPLAAAVDNLSQLANLPCQPHSTLIALFIQPPLADPKERAKISQEFLQKRARQLAVAAQPKIGDYLRIIRLLLSHHANPNVAALGSGRVLGAAVSSGSLDCVQVLIHYGSRVNAGDDRQITPLMCCGGKYATEIAALLITRGAVVNTHDRDGETPFSCAVKTRDAALVRLLLRHGANPSTHTLDGTTPLSYAIETKNNEAAVLIRAALKSPRPH